MPITPLPAPPLRSDGPATFADKGDAFMAALPTFVTQANALESNVGAKEASAVAAADTATTKATEASASAQAAAANSAAAKWVSGTTYAIGDVRWSPANYLAYRRKTAGAGTADPSLDATNWVQLVTLPVQTGAAGKVLRSDGVNATWGGTSLFRSIRTSNTVLSSIDTGTLIDITSGTFTQTFAAAATLGNGWWCYLRNSGTGDITLDPNGAEQIDGLTSYVMYPGECRLLQCDGSALRSVVLNGFSRTFTTSGGVIKPPGYTRMAGLIWSGGHSGSYDNAGSATGGAGGGCLPFDLPASSFAATETVVIGAGGASVVMTGGGEVPGNLGGDSYIGALVRVYAGLSYDTGGAALRGLTAPSGFGGGYAYAAAVPSAAPNPTIFAGMSSCTSGPPSQSLFGGGNGGPASPSVPSNRPGGSSVYGGPGGDGGDKNNGVGTDGANGTAPGGGGGGVSNRGAYSSVTARSGEGARGELRIWGII